ncbi:MAG: riboflavin synthase [Verrucomicrobia bacterium]|nr:riboflavin synthase [Verrucomicrobiota bacterium]
MFTGIVEETGRVAAVRETSRAIELAIGLRLCSRGLKTGDSLAVNGCCLTVAALRRSGAGVARARFDLLRETWERTNLQFVRAGSRVNLERSLRADGRLGGHFVTGHVDGLGRIARWEKSGRDHVLDIEAPRDVLRYIVPKGCVAVDGVSLTVANVIARGFRIWIIPHTLAVTALRERKAGDAVNLEADLLGKHVDRLLQARR